MWGTQSTCGVREGLASTKLRFLKSCLLSIHRCLIGECYPRGYSDPTTNRHGSLPPDCTLSGVGFAQLLTEQEPLGNASSRLFPCPRRCCVSRIAVACSSNDADPWPYALNAPSHRQFRVLQCDAQSVRICWFAYFASPPLTSLELGEATAAPAVLDFKRRSFLDPQHLLSQRCPASLVSTSLEKHTPCCGTPGRQQAPPRLASPRQHR